ncbi:uncharacterized zinc finger protein CG2678 [Drosophila ficusphila]|uniref:uncharacterized zinc finger protein CG2678 n=1 Tax=Drosophila ficusphila TaxID=30025 RepID=UPI0007E6596E|nr:uncharacterized zinc finger protein CG2678 [Drosophila ficusphila]
MFPKKSNKFKKLMETPPKVGVELESLEIMKNVCRVCMDETATLMDIFADIRDPSLDEPETSMSHILAQCTNRTVERGDLLPHFICLSCVNAAQESFRFKWRSERSYQYFCNLLNKPYLASDRETNRLQYPDQKPESEKKEEENLNSGLKTQRHQDQQQTDDSAESCANQNFPKKITTQESPKKTPKSSHFMCVHCSKKFNSKSELESHISDECLRCSDCQRTYSSKHSLKRHLLTHTGKPMHKCPHCPKAFMRSDYLKGHLRTHDNDGPLTCDQCSAVFSEGNMLALHRKEHLTKTVLESDSSENHDSESSDQEQDVEANYAQLSFEASSKLTDSSRSSDNLNIDNNFDSRQLRNENPLEHDEESSDATEDSGLHKNDNQKLLRRLRNSDHETCPSGQAKKPKCHICLKSFCRIYSLNRHMLTHKADRRPLKCSYCCEEFPTDELLKSHERTHLGDSFRCEFCSLVFKEVHFLREHQHRIHSNTSKSLQGKEVVIRLTRGKLPIKEEA